MKKILLVSLITLITSGCASVNVDLTKLPDQDKKYASALEQELGAAGSIYMGLSFKAYDSAKMQHRLARLGSKITKHTERSKIKYHFLVIDSKYHNAFAFPGGYIYFTQALMHQLKTDEKIQAVLAHEIAHVTHKHSLQEYERQSKINFLGALLGQRVFDISTQMAYHRAFELQADQTGGLYLQRAGLDPKILLDVLYDLEETAKLDEQMHDDYVQKGLAEKSSKIAEKLLTTHPHAQERINKYKEFLEQLEVGN